MLTRKLVLSTLAIITLTTAAQAAVYGTNEFLSENGGKAFVPMKQATSGVLGETTDSGRVIGTTPDQVALSQGQSSSGYLIYDLYFDLSENYTDGGGEPTPLTSDDIDTSEPINLTLDLFDIDFSPIKRNGMYYYETMDISFVRTDGFSATEDLPQVSLNAENYGDYREDEFGATNNIRVEYTVDLLGDMGLTSDDLDQLLADMGFTLQITLTSYIQQNGPGTYLYRNAREYLGDYSANSGVAGSDPATNELQFGILDPVPEPASMALLALGSLIALRRKN